MIKCWNCGGEVNANSKYEAEGEPICGYCAEDFAEKAGDTCSACGEADFNWSDERDDLICGKCGKEGGIL